MKYFLCTLFCLSTFFCQAHNHPNENCSCDICIECVIFDVKTDEIINFLNQKIYDVKYQQYDTWTHGEYQYYEGRKTAFKEVLQFINDQELDFKAESFSRD